MKGEPQFFVLKREAWMDAAEYQELILGAIVKNPVDPLTNYVSVHEEDPNKINMKFHADSSTDYLLINDATKSEELAASFTKWAGFTLVSTVQNRMQLSGENVSYRRIKKLDQFWETLKNVETVSRTAIDWVRNPGPWPPCLIVGILICEHAEIHSEHQRSRNIGGGVEPSMDPVAASAGVPGSLSSALKSKISLSRSTESTAKAQSDSSDSRICAVEVRTITTPLLKRRLQLKEDGPKLAGSKGTEEAVTEPITARDLLLDSLDDSDVEDLIR